MISMKCLNVCLIERVTKKYIMFILHLQCHTLILNVVNYFSIKYCYVNTSSQIQTYVI